MKQELQKLIDELYVSYVKRMEESELINAYYGDGEEDFSDWASGNFNDDVDLGTRIGAFEVAEEVISQLKQLIEE